MHDGEIKTDGRGQGDFFVLSAPSGTGKTTLIRRLLGDRRLGSEGLHFSVSHTTRAPRQGEVDGKDYHFLEREEFEARIRAGGFLEWAEVHGNLYGTSVEEVLPRLAAGTDVLADIDVQGALQVMAAHPAAVTLFLLPPSPEALADRLRGRGLDDPAVVERRLEAARGELLSYDRYQYAIVNDDIDRASRALAAIILTHRHRLERMRKTAEQVVSSLRRDGGSA